MANSPPNGSDPKSNERASADAEPNAEPGSAAEQRGPARSPAEAIAALQAEVAELKDKWLRTHADLDNLRKRTEREKEEIAKYAVTRLAHEIITVGDNFQRAIDAVPAEAAEKDPVLKSFLDGVTLTERELLNALERHGIRRQQPMNEPFSPHLHQAVMEVPRTDVPEGTVVQVFQPGFMIEDRVLRPAMVGVAKGGPKPASAPEGSGQVPPPANENAPPD